MWHDIVSYSKFLPSMFSVNAYLETILTKRIVIWYILKTEIALELCMHIRNCMQEYQMF